MPCIYGKPGNIISSIIHWYFQTKCVYPSISAAVHCGFPQLNATSSNLLEMLNWIFLVAYVSYSYNCHFYSLNLYSISATLSQKCWTVFTWFMATCSYSFPCITFILKNFRIYNFLMRTFCLLTVYSCLLNKQRLLNKGVCFNFQKFNWGFK